MAHHRKGGAGTNCSLKIQIGIFFFPRFFIFQFFLLIPISFSLCFSVQPRGCHLVYISAVPAEGGMFQCRSTGGTNSWQRTSPHWWPWLLNTFPFSKDNKHTFVPPKHRWRRLGHPVSLGPLVPGWACLGWSPSAGGQRFGLGDNMVTSLWQDLA